MAIALILIWIGYWYWETLEAMAQIWWRSETYTHGLVVPLISLWLIWRDRHRLILFQPQSTLLLAIPLVAFVFLWLLGEVAAVNALAQFSIIGIIVVAAIAILGLPISKELSFPFLFLFFAVPVGDFLMPSLMEWTADFTVLAVRLSGIPVYREGQNFVIPSGNWSVVEACSGIRYLIASLMVGTLFAYLTYTSFRRRLMFILVSLLVPIVANWLRAYLIVILGHLSGNRLAAGVDHVIYGWVFFGVVITIMFAIGMRWAEIPRAPNQQDLFRKKPAPRSVWLVLASIAFIIIIGPMAEINLRKIHRDGVIKLSPPTSVGRWQNQSPAINWQPNYSNPAAQIYSAYSNDSGSVGLYLAYYRNQNQDSKLVTSTNALVGSNDPIWQIVNSSFTTVNIAGIPQVIRQAELIKKQSSLDDRYIVWQWYWINGQITSSDIKAKWLTALSVLAGHGDDSATVILYAPKNDSAKMLSQFTNEMSGQIHHALAETWMP